MKKPEPMPRNPCPPGDIWCRACRDSRPRCKQQAGRRLAATDDGVRDFTSFADAARIVSVNRVFEAEFIDVTEIPGQFRHERSLFIIGEDARQIAHKNRRRGGLIGRRLHQRAALDHLQDFDIGKLLPAGLRFAQIVNDTLHLPKITGANGLGQRLFRLFLGRRLRRGQILRRDAPGIQKRLAEFVRRHGSPAAAIKNDDASAADDMDILNMNVRRAVDGNRRHFLGGESRQGQKSHQYPGQKLHGATIPYGPTHFKLR